MSTNVFGLNCACAAMSPEAAAVVMPPIMLRRVTVDSVIRNSP
jgi:hypothetical protein